MTILGLEFVFEIQISCFPVVHGLSGECGERDESEFRLQNDQRICVGIQNNQGKNRPNEEKKRRKTGKEQNPWQNYFRGSVNFFFKFNFKVFISNSVKIYFKNSVKFLANFLFFFNLKNFFQTKNWQQQNGNGKNAPAPDAERHEELSRVLRTSNGTAEQWNGSLPGGLKRTRVLGRNQSQSFFFAFFHFK